MTVESEAIMSQSAMPAESHAPKDKKHRLRRATAVVAATGALVYTATEVVPHIVHAGERAFHRVIEHPDNPQDSFTNPFRDPLANVVAQENGITVGKYWRIDNKLTQKLKVNPADAVYNIYPPAVMEHKDLFETVSEETGVPANVLATIASIESQGKVNADSGPAKGLMQIYRDVHKDEIVQVAKKLDMDVDVNNDESLDAALDDPEVSVRVGALILKADYRATLKASTPDNLYPEGSIRAWARTAAAYNGGASQIRIDYDKMNFQSARYTDNFTHFLTTGVVASGLYSRGYEDDDIASALISDEIDARIYAYNGLKEQSRKGKNPLSEYSKEIFTVRTNLAQQDVTEPTLRDKVKEYKAKTAKGGPVFKYPVTAPERIYLGSGGEPLFKQSPENTDLDNYPQQDK